MIANTDRLAYGQGQVISLMDEIILQSGVSGLDWELVSVGQSFKNRDTLEVSMGGCSRKGMIVLLDIGECCFCSVLVKDKGQPFLDRDRFGDIYSGVCRVVQVRFRGKVPEIDWEKIVFDDENEYRRWESDVVECDGSFDGERPKRTETLVRKRAARKSYSLMRFVEDDRLFLKVLTAFTASGIPYAPKRVVAGVLKSDDPRKCSQIVSFLAGKEYLERDSRRAVLSQLTDKGFRKISELLEKVKTHPSV